MTIVTPTFRPDPDHYSITPKSAQVAIVIPCYNEAERLDLSAFEQFLRTRPDISFVFVDDGSRDDTLAVLSVVQAAAPAQVSILSLSQNSGKGEAVRQGLLYATGTEVGLVGYWDADLATPLDAIDDFVRVARKFDEVSIVFGSRRALLGHRIERSVKRRMVSRVCALLARQAVRLPVSDTQCGAKLLRNNEALRAVIAAPFTAGWLFDVELIARLSARLNWAGRAFYEQPLSEWDEIPGSKVSGSAIIRSGLCMLRLIAEMRLGWPSATVGEGLAPVAQIIAAADAPVTLAA